LIPLEACSSVFPDSNRTIGKPDADGNVYTLDGITKNQLTKNDLCTKAGDENPLMVNGAEDSEEFTYIQLRVFPCNSARRSCVNFYLKENMETFLKNETHPDVENVTFPAPNPSRSANIITMFGSCD
jgi:hypothetical protein